MVFWMKTNFKFFFLATILNLTFTNNVFSQAPSAEEEEFKKEVEEDIKQTGRKQIWVKILPPGIVFLLFGYIINLFVGNILFLIYHFALG